MVVRKGKSEFELTDIEVKNKKFTLELNERKYTIYESEWKRHQEEFTQLIRTIKFFLEKLEQIGFTVEEIKDSR